MPLLLTISVLLGLSPDPEVVWIRAHLRAARAFAASHDTSHLTPQQQVRREAALAVLDDYIVAGNFPQRTTDPYGARRRDSSMTAACIEAVAADAESAVRARARPKLHKVIREAFDVARQPMEGKPEAYFRIDADVKTSVTITVTPPL